MKINDFRCMRGGKQYDTLSDKDLPLLAPIEKRKKNKQTKALLMLHGFSSSPAVYRYFIDKLDYYDALIVPVLPGHAASIEDFEKIQASDWMAAVYAICDDLTQKYESVDVLGFSLGGLLASYLSHHFKLNHLYLLAPAFDLILSIPRSIQLGKFLKSLGFQSLRNAAGNLYTSTHCEIAYRQLPISTIIEMLRFVQNFSFTPPNCPTDLFLGCHDLVVDSVKIAERFQNNKGTSIHWLENSAHVLPLDGDIELILNCIHSQNSI